MVRMHRSYLEEEGNAFSIYTVLWYAMINSSISKHCTRNQPAVPKTLKSNVRAFFGLFAVSLLHWLTSKLGIHSVPPPAEVFTASPLRAFRNRERLRL